MSKPPLQSLPAFVAAARMKNLTRAAEQMNLTVSALSHQMRGLEERLGVQLFLRTPRGVTLTPQGAELLAAVEPHFDGIERAFARMRERPSNALTLSALPSFSSSWLMPRLSDFMSRHPALELNLQTSIALVDFERENVDAAMRLGSGEWPGLTSEHLFDEYMTPMASPKLIARLGKPTLRDLHRWPLLGEFDDDNKRWRRWFARYGGTLPRRFVASFTDAELLQKAAAEGLGVALGRVLLARPLLDNGSLVVLTKEQMPAGYSHYLVYPQRSAQHPALLAFRAWLLEQAHAPKPRRRKR